MTREEIYSQCQLKAEESKCLLLEAATGTGKTKISIDLVNYLVDKEYKGKNTSMLLLVAKTVHKQTWKEEIEKWGGVGINNIVIECYESLKKHVGESFDIIVMDEVHHVGSELRMELLSSLSYGRMIGLSATIPRKLKKYFQFRYHAVIVSCDLEEAIEDNILPEPQILLMPLTLDNTKYTETWEINTKVGGPIQHGSYRDLWKYKKEKVHAILACTQKQKLIEYNKLIEWEKSRYMRTRHPGMERSWLFHSGKRLEFLAYCKNQIVYDILKKLSRYRTITFCKTIEQAEILGKNCIHSKNKDADEVYMDFNKKKINHITAVNILNENANLVDCKYAIFANISSSEIISCQRLGRSLRHKSPVIIIPFFKDTREEEIIRDKMLEGFNKDFIKVIHSINEI